MDRVATVLFMLGMTVSLILIILALFAVAPIYCSCLVSLLYTLYVFISNEASGMHHAQEFENRFWTIFAGLFSTALFFAKDSPIALGRWNPSVGFFGVLIAGYSMHAWDRHVHRKGLTRNMSLRRSGTVTSSLVRLSALGIRIEDQMTKINACLSDIDQLLIPSTINNFINQRFILRKEREIISVFEEADPKSLNYIITHSKLGLLFYKIKDHRHFSGQHRTELIELLAVERISQLSVVSRVVVLHALQMMKLPANARAEYWVRNIILSTQQDALSELKTLTDTKGDYFSMNKLIYDDLRSDSVRQDILKHLQREAKVQQAHMAMGTKKAKLRKQKAWRKVLSDVDDTLTCSGGSYPAGIDKQYGKRVVYPGVLAFYRELDLGTQGPEEWPDNTVGNLVFLSARPHLYKDVSEKANFAKFEKLRLRGGVDGRRGMHTVPSLLAGDLSSGREYIMTNDFEPLALKKFKNFQRYVSIYPEFRHVFVCDNGQGDVRAGELMFDAFPLHLEALYVHEVQSRHKTHGYAPDRWRKKGLRPCFFKAYPEAALDAAKRKPPLIRISGLRRICQEAVNDFYMIQMKEWPSQKHKWDRRDALNQSIWRANQFLTSCGYESVPLIEADRIWRDGQKVRTPYGLGTIVSFDAIFDMYEVYLDWRPLNVQVAEYKKILALEKVKEVKSVLKKGRNSAANTSESSLPLATVLETVDEVDEDAVSQAISTETMEDIPLMLELMPKKSALIDSDTIKANEENDKKAELSLSNTLASSSKKVTLNDKQPGGDCIVEPDKGKSSTSDKGNASALKSNELEILPSILDQIHPVNAKIQGRYITKYSPPTLPAFPKEEKGRSVFSFWSTGVEAGKASKTKEKGRKTGEKCSTPYGPAVVVEYREAKGTVVVNMVGWPAQAYLQRKDVKIGGDGLIGNLLRRMTSMEAEGAQQRSNSYKEIEVPFSKGTFIRTPYGDGVVARPILVLKDKKDQLKGSLTLKDKGDDISISITNGEMSLSSRGRQQPKSETVGISLSSWSLADKSHPMVYCTADTAKEWKKRSTHSKSRSGSIFSVFGTIVLHSMKLITGNEKAEKKRVPQIVSAPRFQQYYKDGAAVKTTFGDGFIRSFRESDGFYVVSLLNWTLTSGKYPTAYLQKDVMSHCIAKGCHEGYPVLTSLGLSGNLASVNPTTGVHIVTIPSAGMVCYLQPKDVVCPLKAAVGEDVLTLYGEGKVLKYRQTDDVYEIALKGFGAILYSKGENFDRVKDGLEDGQGSFGMNWLLRFLFFSSNENTKAGGSQRSRSNSIASLSVKSHSNRSIT